MYTGSRIKELFMVMKEDKKWEGIIVQDLKNDEVHGILDKESNEVIFFGLKGILLSTKLSELKLLKRKDLYYICHKGTKCSVISSSI